MIIIIIMLKTRTNAGTAVVSWVKVPKRLPTFGFGLSKAFIISCITVLIY